MAKANIYGNISGFVYDFNKDGGNVGLINTGLFLPQRAVIWNVSMNTVIELTSGGMADVSVGFVGNLEALVSSLPISNFSLNEIVAGEGLAVAPVMLLTSQEVIMSIEDFALLTGKFFFHCSFYVSRTA